MKNGFDLSKPMQIDFFLAVLSMEKGIKISQIVENLDSIQVLNKMKKHKSGLVIAQK